MALWSWSDSLRKGLLGPSTPQGCLVGIHRFDDALKLAQCTGNAEKHTDTDCGVPSFKTSDGAAVDADALRELFSRYTEELAPRTDVPAKVR